MSNVDDLDQHPFECLPLVPKRTNPFEPLQRLEQPQVAGSAWSLRHYQVPFLLLYTSKVAQARPGARRICRDADSTSQTLLLLACRQHASEGVAIYVLKQAIAAKMGRCDLCVNACRRLESQRDAAHLHTHGMQTAREEEGTVGRVNQAFEKTLESREARKRDRDTWSEPKKS